jgi:hypothetical protein
LISEYEDKRKTNDLCKRSWYLKSFLDGSESPGEKLLSRFPVINSIQARVFISLFSLEELFRLSVEEMIEKLRFWIEETRIRIFYALIHVDLES